MAEAKYPHLGFKEWPFQIVPDERFVGIWADRKEILDDVKVILNTLRRREQSTINLIWAWYGAGKSHTLKHISYLCRTSFKELLTVYTEFPRSVQSFLDLYIYFITGFGADLIKELAAENPANPKIRAIYPEFQTAIEMVNSGTSASPQAGLQWIMGGRYLNPTLKKKHIERCIENSDDAVRAMTCIISMINASAKYHRLIWMIDEFQRINTEQPGTYEDLSTGLHSVFNACPNSMSIFLSFSVKEQREMFSLLSKEIIDRIGIQKVIAISELTPKEAFNFVGDLMYEFRADPASTPSPFFPFDEEAVKFIISLIEKNSELKPRAIMQYFNAVLEQADLLMVRGEMQKVDVEFAKKILLDYDLFLSFQKESLFK